jgi:polysaccharide deacetylase 2 family uncharacterized protein YibQ
MNQFKNFVILVLSAIIVVQSLFLIRFLTGQRPAQKQVSVRPVALKPEKPVPPQFVPEQPAPKAPLREQVGKIALVLDDWGYNLKNKDFITENDFRVTLSILPFKPYSTEISELAFAKNKDVIVHMPMEPHNREQYGLEEHTLLTSMNKNTIGQILDAAFQTVPHAKGLSNHMGSKATEDPRLMKSVLEYLKSKNLFFLDSLVTNNSVGRALSKKYSLGFAQRDIFIDNETDPEYIREQLLKLAQRARRLGIAVGIGHDRVHTIEVLKAMIPQLEAQGYQFVNLSEIIGDDSARH